MRCYDGSRHECGSVLSCIIWQRRLELQEQTCSRIENIAFNLIFIYSRNIIICYIICYLSNLYIYLIDLFIYCFLIDRSNWVIGLRKLSSTQKVLSNKINKIQSTCIKYKRLILSFKSQPIHSNCCFSCKFASHSSEFQTFCLFLALLFYLLAHLFQSLSLVHPQSPSLDFYI